MKLLSSILCFLCGALTLAAQTKKPARSQRPNIVYIMADDHTSQAWGIYGGILKDYVQYSNMKRLADKGAILTNTFCTNSICVPSRATILTGEYSNVNKVYTLGDSFSPDSANIAKELQKAGYQTALFGKWHLKKMPAGFDTFSVLPGQGIYHDPTFLSKDNWNDQEHTGKKMNGFVDDLTMGMSIDWITQRDTSKPFFLMCHFKSTHEPFDFPDKFKDLYKGVVFPYPSTFLDSGAATTGRTFPGQPLEEMGSRYIKATTGPFWTSYPELPFDLNGLSPLEARKKIYQKMIRDYLRCVAGINANIGKMLDYLEKTGLDKNTVIIYTSDQGYFLGEHDFMDKRMMYEESLRMPFIISYPREIKPGTRVNDMILNIDFAALFADYAGIKKPSYIQGTSFRNNLKGHTSATWRKSMYYRYWEHDPQRPAHFGVRNERYKLIFFYGLPLGMRNANKKSSPPGWEFFDLKTDPLEVHNAVHDKQYAVIIQKMKIELEKLKAQAGDDDSAFPEAKEIYRKTKL